ncbi:MFS transporter [Halobacteriales archaeon QS_1_68_20]|nr:MAG: MFS transporter [Halobacteriales archaeon QS_1_68_20]
MASRFSLPQRTVLKYYLYMSTKWAHLTGPIWVLFLLSRGLSYTQIGLLDSLFAVAVLFGEVPTGFVADRIGRRNSLLIGIALLSSSSILMAFGTNFYMFAVFYVLWSLGQTFQSGTDSAWLYDILREGDGLGEEEYARVRGRGNAIGLLVSGGTALVGGYMGEINLAMPWIVSGLLVALGFLVVLSMPETEQFEDDDADPFTVFDVLPMVRERFFGTPLGPFVVYVGLFLGVLGAIDYFVQPISRDVGLSVRHLGWMYAGFTVVGAAVSYKIDDVERVVGLRRWFTVIPPALGVLFVAVVLFPPVAIPLFFMMKGVRNGTDPLETEYINDNTVSKGRATVISIVFMVHSLFEIPLAVGGGAIADLLSPLGAVAVLGGLMAAGAILIRLWSEPVAEPDDEIVVDDPQAIGDD